MAALLVDARQNQIAFHNMAGRMTRSEFCFSLQVHWLSIHLFADINAYNTRALSAIYIKTTVGGSGIHAIICDAHHGTPSRITICFPTQGKSRGPFFFFWRTQHEQ